MYLKKQIPTAILLSILTLFVINLEAAQVTWTGAGSNDWNTGGNWSTSTVPTASDTVIFTGSVTFGLILTADVTVMKFIIENSLNQPINLGNFTINIMGDCELSDFGSSFSFTDLASLRFRGGGPQSFTPMATMEHPKIVTDCTSTDVTINTISNPIFRAIEINTNSILNAPASNELIIRGNFVSLGTFNPNGGSVAFDSTGGTQIVDIQSSSFNNVKFNGNGSYTFSSPLDVQGTMTIDGPTLQMGSSIHSIASITTPVANSGTLNMQTADIQLSGNLDLSGLMTLNFNDAAKFTFTGIVAQSITPVNSFELPKIHCMNSGGDVNFSTSGPIYVRDMQIDAGGSLTAPNIDTLVIRSGFFNAGTFNHNSGTVKFDSTAGSHSIDIGTSSFYNLNIAGSAQYNLSTNLTVDNTLDLNGGDINFGSTLTHSINSISTQVGTSTLSLNNSTIEFIGNIDISNLSTFNWTEGAIFNFIGGSPQTINSGTLELPTLTFNNSGGDVSFTTSGITYVRDIQINAGGSVTGPSVNDLVIRNNFTNSSGVYNHNNGIIKFDTTGGTHTIDAGGSSFFKLYFTGTGTYQFASNLSVLDTLSLSGATIDLGTGYTHQIKSFSALAATGTLNLNTSQLNISGDADFSNLMSLQWQEGALLNFNGIVAQTLTPLNTLDHPAVRVANTSSSFMFGSLSNDVTLKSLQIDIGASFNAPSSWKLKLRSDFTNNGTFIHNNGIVEFDSTNGTHNIYSANPFNDLNINGSGASYQFTSNIQASKLVMQNGTLNLNSSFTHTIDTITSLAGASSLDFNNSRLITSGNIDITNVTTIIAASDTIELNGIGTQTVSAPASTTIGNVLKSGTGTLSLGNNLDVSSYTQTDGTLSLVSFDLNVQGSGDLTINKGSITGLDARQILVTGNANIVGAPADSVFITPATVGYLNVTGSLNANYAVIGNVNANGSQGIAINSRNAGGNINWAFPPATTVDLFFSVGTNTANLLTSSSFSTNGDTAIFGTAQLDNIGVGDRIDYDGGFSAYIKERLSSTQYVIRKADGSFPDSSTVQVDGIYRAFNSLSSALDSMNMASLISSTNLKAINARLHIACYADSIDTMAVNIYGFETDAQNGISIFSPGPVDQVGIPQNHHGMWTTDGYQLSVSGTGVSGRVIWIQVPYIKIQGLQIEYTGSNANAIQTIAVEADSCAISNNIIRLSESTPPNQRMGINIGGQYYTRISNNLIYGFIGGSASDAAIYTNTGLTNMAMPVYNNTIYNCATGIQSFPNNAILAKNNLVYNCTAGYGGGTFATGSANNLSGPVLADAPGSSALQMTSISFLDTINGNFRLMYNTAAINMGVNLTSDPYLALDDDITFQPRDATFDIGAFEYNNNIPNIAVLDTFIAGETISTNTVPYSVNLQFDISDSDTMSMVKFQLQIDDTSDFSSPVIDTTELVLLSSPRNNIIVPVILNSGSYYWRVRALDQFNAPSTWSVANAGSIAFTIDGPDAPTDIILSNTTVNENAAANTVVGVISTTDPDVGNTFTYSFYAGPGDSNNSSFTIVGDTLKTSSTFNYENQNNYSILLSTMDNSSLSFQKQITITINDVNEMPTLISLNDTTINENSSIGSVVGILNSTDEDLLDKHTYSFSTGTGDTNNSDFSISNDTLKSANIFNYETKSSYTIRLTTTDSLGLTFSKPFLIKINNVNEAPTDIILSDTTLDENLPASTFIGTLSSIDEDSSDSHSYQLIAGAGDVNNANFSISQDSLFTTTPFDYETQSIHSIRISASDANALSFEKIFQISINDIAEDTSTQMPSLTLPASNDTIHNFFSIDFTLPEQAQASSVIMTFMQTGGTSDFNSPHVLTFNTTFEDSGNHATILNAKDLSNNTFLASCSSDPNDFLEHEGIYSVKIGYQDTLGNTLSEVIASNVMFTDTIVTGPAPVIVSSAYYESTDILEINFDKKIEFIDSTKNFFLSTDNGISDTVIIQAPWSWNFKDTTFKSVQIAVPTADISLLEGLANKDSLEISMQDSTFGDSIAWNIGFDYSMNFKVIYYYENLPLTISSVTYIDSTNKLIFTFNDTITFIDTTKNLGLLHKEDTTLTLTVPKPWAYEIVSTKDTVKITLLETDAIYVENWSGVDSSLALILSEGTFSSSMKTNSVYNFNILFPVNFLDDHFLHNMFGLSLNNSGDSAIEAYLYFVNDSIHDTGSGLFFNFGFGDTDIDTTLTPWAYKDSSFFINNTAKQGYWYFTWAPINLYGQIGEVKKDSLLISNTAPKINLSSSYTINEDSLFSLTNFVSDINGDSIYLSLTNAPDGLILNQSDNTLSWTPQNSDVGFNDFTIIAIDSWGDTTLTTVEINVLNINDAPSIDTINIPDSIKEDSVVSFFIKAIDIDIQDSLILSIDSSINWIELTSFVKNSDGTYQFTLTASPVNSDVGSHIINLNISDNSNNSISIIDTIEVINTNDMPIFDTVAIADTIYEDSLTVGYIKAYDIDKNDSIKLFIELDSSWIEITSLDYDSLGNFKFGITLTPNNNNTGIKTVKYHIQDNSGSAVAYFDTIFVVNTNDAPSIALTSKQVNHGAVSLSFEAEDDFDTTFNFILNLTSSKMNAIDTNTSGNFNYYPLEDGSYEISCKVIDNGNLSAFAIDSFTISGSSKKIFTKSTDWNMISIPTANYSANTFKTAGTILHWDETKEASNIYKYYTRESGINTLTSGESYFIKNSDSSIVISLDGDSLIKDNFIINLNSGEYGWNQIGSPYSYPVKVEDSTLTFWEYDPSVKEYVDAQGILMPWKGYWIQTDESAALSLNSTPYIKGTRARRSISRHRGEEDWIYSVSLETESSIDRDNYFGFAPDATNGKDHFDRLEAPRMNDAPYLFFKPIEWQDKSNRYASDVRHKRAREDFFNIGISGSSENIGDMTIKITGYTENEDVYLFVRTKDGISSYDPNSDLTIKPSDKDQYITIISSWKPELSIPLTFKTFSPYPNPCKPIANIRYTLPYSWEADGSFITGFNVKITIFDVKGRKVKELLNGKQKPGIHKVVWNGKNGGGSLAASGAYFIKIDAGKHRAVKKIMLMR